MRGASYTTLVNRGAAGTLQMGEYIITNYNRYIQYQNELKQLRVATKGKKSRRRRAKKQLRKKYGLLSKSQAKERVWYIYGIECESGNYYVGLTAYKEAIRRYQQHCDGEGARWTKLHKPIRLIEARNIGFMTRHKAEEHEQSMALEYIEKYGVEVVRGGRLVSTDRSRHLQQYNSFSKVTIIKARGE